MSKPNGIFLAAQAKNSVDDVDVIYEGWRGGRSGAEKNVSQNAGAFNMSAKRGLSMVSAKSSFARRYKCQPAFTGLTAAAERIRQNMISIRHDLSHFIEEDGKLPDILLTLLMQF